MHSLWIETNLDLVESNLDSKTDIELFSKFFRKRITENLKTCSGIDYFFVNEIKEKNILKSFKALQKKELNEFQEELKKQKNRLLVVNKKLKHKKTKTAELEKSRAERKIEKLKKKLDRIKRGPRANESRIFPNYFAPIVICKDGKNWIQPFRFHLRPKGKTEKFDKEYDGTYKARKESLTEEYFTRVRKFGNEEKASIWEPIFGKKHGIIVIKKFFEAVPAHIHEKRELKKGEVERAIHLGFESTEEELLIVPCLYDISGPKSNPLRSFAIITEEAPLEVKDLGYHRCPVFLRPDNISDWLNPHGKTNKELHEILKDSRSPKMKLAA